MLSHHEIQTLTAFTPHEGTRKAIIGVASAMQDTGFNLLPLMKKAHELKNAAPHQTPAPDAQIFLQAVLRTLRRQNYMTQNDIAGALDLSHSTIQSIEGTKIPGIKQDRFFSDKILYAYAQRELSLKKALDILATEVLYPHGIKTTLDLLLLLSKKSDKSIDQIGEGASVNHLNSKLQKSNSRIRRDSFKRIFIQNTLCRIFSFKTT